MIIRLDEHAGPLFEQIAAAIRRAIAAGTLKPGDGLPPARALAASLSINMHTVLRAFGVLRDEGLISLRRRQGAIVLPAASRHVALATLANEFIASAKDKGYSPHEIRRSLETVL